MKPTCNPGLSLGQAVTASVIGQLRFLSITSIPDWAMTDLGLVDCIKFEVIDPVLATR